MLIGCGLPRGRSGLLFRFWGHDEQVYQRLMMFKEYGDEGEMPNAAGSVRCDQ